MMNVRAVRFPCTQCGAELQADARAVGYEVDCPQCGEILVVPSSTAPVDQPKTPAPDPAPLLPQPSAAPIERLQPKMKFCISCNQDVPQGDLICPHCGGGRFGRL